MDYVLFCVSLLWLVWCFRLFFSEQGNYGRWRNNTIYVTLRGARCNVTRFFSCLFALVGLVCYVFRARCSLKKRTLFCWTWCTAMATATGRSSAWKSARYNDVFVLSYQYCRGAYSKFWDVQLFGVLKYKIIGIFFVLPLGDLSFSFYA